MGGNVDIELFWSLVNTVLDFCFVVVIFDSSSPNFSPNKYLFLIQSNSNDCSFRISFTFVEFEITLKAHAYDADMQENYMSAQLRGQSAQTNWPLHDDLH